MPQRSGSHPIGAVLHGGSRQVVLQLKNGGVIAGEVVMTTDTVIVLAWQEGYATFEKSEIQNILWDEPAAAQSRFASYQLNKTVLTPAATRG